MIRIDRAHGYAIVTRCHKIHGHTSTQNTQKIFFRTGHKKPEAENGVLEPFWLVDTLLSSSWRDAGTLPSSASKQLPGGIFHYHMITHYTWHLPRSEGVHYKQKPTRIFGSWFCTLAGTL